MLSLRKDESSGVNSRESVGPVLIRYGTRLTERAPVRSALPMTPPAHSMTGM